MAQRLNRLDLLRLVNEDQALRPGQSIRFGVRREVGGGRTVRLEARGKVVTVEKDAVTVALDGEHLEIYRYGNPDWDWEGNGMLPLEQSQGDDSVFLGEV
jgi:hypothetical protein